jgi:hypothetical protein
MFTTAFALRAKLRAYMIEETRLMRSKRAARVRGPDATVKTKPAREQFSCPRAGIVLRRISA